MIISGGLDGLPGISNTGGLGKWVCRYIQSIFNKYRKHVASLALVPPCAPDELSNLRFYNALNGHAWLNNGNINKKKLKMQYKSNDNLFS